MWRERCLKCGSQVFDWPAEAGEILENFKADEKEVLKKRGLEKIVENKKLLEKPDDKGRK